MVVALGRGLANSTLHHDEPTQRQFGVDASAWSSGPIHIKALHTNVLIVAVQSLRTLVVRPILCPSRCK